MKCPNCHIDLQPKNDRGVAVNTCPKCKSVWFTPAKLDEFEDLAIDPKAKTGSLYIVDWPTHMQYTENLWHLPGVHQRPRLVREAALRADMVPQSLLIIRAVRVIKDAIVAGCPWQPTTQTLPWSAASDHRWHFAAEGGRFNWRGGEIKMSNYKKKCPEYLAPPQPSVPFQDDIVILK